MDTYTLLREFADSWFLIFMFSFFVGTGIWAFWPSQRPARDDAAQIPFRDTAQRDAPAGAASGPAEYKKG